jgi:hypothetical protein
MHIAYFCATPELYSIPGVEVEPCAAAVVGPPQVGAVTVEAGPPGQAPEAPSSAPAA